MTVFFLAFFKTAPAVEKWIVQKELEITQAGGTNFSQPSDLALFENKIYLLDSMNNRVCLFDSRGRHVGTVRGTPGKTFSGAMGLAQDYRGKFFVADGYRGRIISFSDEGRPEIFLTIVKEEEERSPDPTSLLFFGDKLYVVDNDNHLIRIFDRDGQSEGKWGGAGEGYGLFKYPFRIAVGPRGRIGVVDVLNGRIQFFTPKGEFLTSLGGLGVVSGTLFRPAGFDIDGKGQIFIADNYFGNVQVFDIAGRLLAVLHDEEGKLLELKNPVSLKVSGSRIYVVEMGADRISVFSMKH